MENKTQTSAADVHAAYQNAEKAENNHWLTVSQWLHERATHETTGDQFKGLNASLQEGVILAEFATLKKESEKSSAPLPLDKIREMAEANTEGERAKNRRYLSDIKQGITHCLPIMPRTALAAAVTKAVADKATAAKQAAVDKATAHQEAVEAKAVAALAKALGVSTEQAQAKLAVIAASEAEPVEAQMVEGREPAPGEPLQPWDSIAANEPLPKEKENQSEEQTKEQFQEWASKTLGGHHEQANDLELVLEILEGFGLPELTIVGLRVEALLTELVEVSAQQAH